MKKVLFLALSAVFCSGLAAQNVDSCEVSSEQFQPAGTIFNMISSLDNNAPVGEQIYPLGKGIFKRCHIKHMLELYPEISKSKVSQADLLSGETLEQDITDTSFGLDAGYSIVFIPGHEENGKLQLNKPGFAFSLGMIASFSISDRYGTLVDMIGKVGVEIGHNKTLGAGFDFLAGYGKSAGDVFFYKNIVEDTTPSSVVPYTAWGTKMGGQLWIKPGLGKNLKKTDVLLFVRFLKAFDPGIMVQDYSAVHHNLWRSENWAWGVVLRRQI